MSIVATPKAVLSTAATARAISPAEARKQLEIPDSDGQHDEYLGDLIAVATERVEHDTGIVALSSTWTLKLDEWPDVIELPIRPVSSVTSITYLDTNGASQTLAASNYELDGDRVTPLIWWAYNVSLPDLRDIQNAVTVTFVAGHATPLAIPALYKHAVKLAVAQEFEDRTGVNVAAIRLIDNAYERIVRRLQRASYP